MLDAGWLWPIVISAIKSVVLLVVLLIYTAYVLYAERKIWASVQLRRGPNVVGPWGLLQSFADLLKFVLKEPIIPAGANKGVFLLAPLVTAVLALSAWAVIPISSGWAIGNINVGVLYLFAISSLGVYGIIMAGWSSNSKYPFLAALRSAAQMVSYEVSIGFVIITVLLCAGSLNLTDIVNAQDTRAGLFGWYWLPLFPMFIIFFVSALAETNRPPFDLVEAESELVAGYAVEYSATPFLLFAGIGVVLFFLATAWVQGLQYFELAAMRFHSAAEAKALRRIHHTTVFIGGLFIAGFVSIPILNLATPLFGTALMVHIHKRLTGTKRRLAEGPVRSP